MRVWQPQVKQICALTRGKAEELMLIMCCLQCCIAQIIMFVVGHACDVQLALLSNSLCWTRVNITLASYCIMLIVSCCLG